jgi:hypothetical protein
MLKHHILVFSLMLMLVLPFTLSGISQAAMLFLTFEPGARANGMGRAYSAIADEHIQCGGILELLHLTKILKLLQLIYRGYKVLE